MSYGSNGQYVLRPSILWEFSTQCTVSHILPLDCPVSGLHDLSPRGEIIEEDTWSNQESDTCDFLTDISIFHRFKNHSHVQQIPCVHVIPSDVHEPHHFEILGFERFHLTKLCSSWTRNSWIIVRYTTHNHPCTYLMVINTPETHRSIQWSTNFRTLGDFTSTHFISPRCWTSELADLPTHVPFDERPRWTLDFGTSGVFAFTYSLSHER